MLFILIGTVFLFIFLIALFGDYENKELKKDYKYMNKICGNKEKIIGETNERKERL